MADPETIWTILITRLNEVTEEHLSSEGRSLRQYRDGRHRQKTQDVSHPQALLVEAIIARY
jgi:hypothetical protein